MKRIRIEHRSDQYNHGEILKIVVNNIKLIFNHYKTIQDENKRNDSSTSGGIKRSQ